MAERSAKQLGLSQSDLPNSVLEVIATLNKGGFEAYLVGGGVRDTLLGLNPKDFDAVTDAKPHEIKDLFGKRCRIIGRRFQLAHVYSGRDMIEVATFRAPPRGDTHTNSDGMIVRDNVWGSIEQDFARRDFTINALYYQPLKGVVHDFCNALDDIKNKRLSLLGDAPVRIEEDPVRLLRALRFKAKLGFEFDDELAVQFNDKNWSLLEQVSPHRLYDESQKMFTGGYLVPLLPLLFEYGAIDHLFIYPPKEPTALVQQVAINTDKRIGVGKSINPAFFYAALLWDNYLYQLAKFKKKNMPFQDAQMQASSKVIERQRIKTAIPRFAEQFIRDIWMLQPKLANPRAKQIYQLAEHPRFRAGFDFLLLREQIGDATNPLSESTNGMGEWWQTYQTLSDKQKQQAISDFNNDGRQSSSGRNRSRNRKNPRDIESEHSLIEENIQKQAKNDTQSRSTSSYDSDDALSPHQTQTQDTAVLSQPHSNNDNEQPQPKGVSIKTSTTIPSKPSNTKQLDKRRMSRPQRAHYNREREQLRKLSLAKQTAPTDKALEAQPKPLFTINAEKLSKQLPQEAVEQILSQQQFDTSATSDMSTADDSVDNVDNEADKPKKPVRSKADKKAPVKDTQIASSSELSTSKTAQEAKSSITDDKAATKDKTLDDKTLGNPNVDLRQPKLKSAVNERAVPSRRRRRQPSTDVTQVERIAQNAEQQGLNVKNSDSATISTPAPIQSINKDTSRGKTNTKPNDAKVKVTEATTAESPSQSKVSEGPEAIVKEVSKSQQTNKKKRAKSESANDTKVEAVTSTQKPTTSSGRVPATRRRRLPSTILTVKERLQENG